MTTRSTEKVEWSADHSVRSDDERRSGAERRQLNGRGITVPDMRATDNRRSGDERRGRVRLTITGRAMNV